MMTMMSRPWLLTMLMLDPTPDGYYEVTIECNGRLVATEIFAPWMDHQDITALQRRLVQAALRRC